MTIKRFFYFIICLNCLVSLCWLGLHFFQPDNALPNATLDTALYHAMLWTTPSWLYLFGRLVDWVAVYSKVGAVLLGIALTGVMLLAGIAYIFIAGFFSPRDVLYEDDAHIVLSGERGCRPAAFVCEKRGLSERQLIDFPLPYEAGETTEWKFYDRLGVVVVGEVNEGLMRETGDSRCYQFYVTDTTAYTRHQAEVQRLRKTYLKKEEALLRQRTHRRQR